jgi:hypothetical protein
VMLPDTSADFAAIFLMWMIRCLGRWCSSFGMFSPPYFSFLFCLPS